MPVLDEFLLRPDRVFHALIVCALLSPTLGFAFRGRFRSARAAACAGALGPWALAMWGLHEALIRIAGFDSLVTMFAMIGAGLAGGLLAALWVNRAPR